MPSSSDVQARSIQTRKGRYSRSTNRGINLCVLRDQASATGTVTLYAAIGLIMAREGQRKSKSCEALPLSGEKVKTSPTKRTYSAVLKGSAAVPPPELASRPSKPSSSEKKTEKAKKNPPLDKAQRLAQAQTSGSGVVRQSVGGMELDLTLDEFQEFKSVQDSVKELTKGYRDFLKELGISKEERKSAGANERLLQRVPERRRVAFSSLLDELRRHSGIQRKLKVDLISRHRVPINTTDESSMATESEVLSFDTCQPSGQRLDWAASASDGEPEGNDGPIFNLVHRLPGGVHPSRASPAPSRSSSMCDTESSGPVRPRTRSSMGRSSSESSPVRSSTRRLADLALSPSKSAAKVGKNPSKRKRTVHSGSQSSSRTASADCFTVRTGTPK